MRAVIVYCTREFWRVGHFNWESITRVCLSTLTEKTRGGGWPTLSFPQPRGVPRPCVCVPCRHRAGILTSVSSLAGGPLSPGVRRFSRFEAVKKPSRKLIDRVEKQGKLG